MDLLYTLHQLNFSDLNDDWVNGLWNSGFTNESSLPSVYENNTAPHSIETILFEIIKHVESNLRNGLVSWDWLVENDVPHKKLIALINNFLSSALKDKQDSESRRRGFYTASLYFVLLAVPGSDVYRIYHSALYGRAVEALTVANQIRLSHATSTPKKSPARRKKSSSQNDSRHYSSDDNILELSFENRRKAIKDVEETLKKLFILLQQGSLARFQDAVLLTVESLTTVTRSLIDNDMESIAEQAFTGLQLLCNQKHGDVEETVCHIMRCNFTSLQLYLNPEDCTTNQDYSQIRDSVIRLIDCMLETIGQPAYKGVEILIHHLCSFAPERVELRLKAAHNIFQLLEKLPNDLFTRTVILILNLSNSVKPVQRLLALEIIGKLMYFQKRPTHGNIDAGSVQQDFPTIEVLISPIICCIKDESSNVKSTAMKILTSLLFSEITQIKRVVEEVFVAPYSSIQDVRKVRSIDFPSFSQLNHLLEGLPHADLSILPDGYTIVKELLLLIEDNRVKVRLSALHCLVNIMRLNSKFMTNHVLKEVSSHCGDEAMMVRKMMVQELTEVLLSNPAHHQLPQHWVQNVLPVIMDAETKVSERVTSALVKVVINNVKAYSTLSNSSDQLPWTIIQIIGALQMRRFFQKACSLWDTDILRPSRLIPIIKSHIGTVNNTSAWLLLRCLAEYLVISDTKFVLDYYYKEIYNLPEVNFYVGQLVLEVLLFSWKNLPRDEQTRLDADLYRDLLHFKVPVPLIALSVNIKHFLSSYLNNIKLDPKLPSSPKWASEIIEHCERNIFDELNKSEGEVPDEEIMKRFIITLGDAMLLCPKTSNSRIFAQLCSMLQPSLEADDLWTGSCSQNLKAALVVTLGKMSIFREDYARQVVKIFDPILCSSESSHVRSNIVVCLTDLCCRYASLVEGLLPEMCACLKDEQTAVRENTLVLLIKLLQEDYIKMRGAMLFHLLSMINDSNSVVSGMTQSYFMEKSVRKKNISSSNLVLAIFHYNAYKTHPKYSKIVLTPKEKSVFNLQGRENLKSRQQIYRFMLSQMEKEVCFQASQLLCGDILGAAVDDIIEMNDEGQSVIKDAIFALGCSEMKSSDRKDDDDSASDDPRAVLLNTANKIVIDLIKKHLLETELPILLKLKTKLVNMKSPLVADVSAHFYRQILEKRINADEILEHDERLRKELQEELCRRRNSEKCPSSVDGFGSSDED